MRHPPLRAAFVILTAILVGPSIAGVSTGCDDTTNGSAGLADVNLAEDVGDDESIEETTGDAETDGDDISPFVPADVTGLGPYRVGFYEWTVSYTPAGSEEERSLRVVYWYPTLSESGPPGQYRFGLLSRDEVLAGAELADDGPYPLLVYSHGAEFSFFLTEFFASHGWIVVSPEHTGDTFVDRSLTGPELVDLRPQDVSAILDELENPGEEHRLAGQIGEQVVVCGHSFGGYTTLAVSGAGLDADASEAKCAALNPDEPEVCDYITEAVQQRWRDGFFDPRIDLGIPLAPGPYALFSDKGLSQIELPILLMTGALDTATPNATEGDPIWNGLDGQDDLRVNFETGGHRTFTVRCVLHPSDEGNGCGEGFIDPEQAHRLINAYALAFSRYHLWGDESVAGIVDGSESDVVILADIDPSDKRCSLNARYVAASRARQVLHVWSKGDWMVEAD